MCMQGRGSLEVANIVYTYIHNYENHVCHTRRGLCVAFAIYPVHLVHYIYTVSYVVAQEAILNKGFDTGVKAVVCYVSRAILIFSKKCQPFAKVNE